MLITTDLEYCQYRCAADHSVDGNEDYCVLGRETTEWPEDFVIHPLDTSEQRHSYREPDELFMRKSMGRGEAAMIFETLAVNAERIENYLSIADATERLAMNSPSWERYIALVIEGFDELEITHERAVYVLTEVSSHGSWGGWPNAHIEHFDHDHYLCMVGAAIRTMINPAWSTELRARLALFVRMNEEEVASL